MPTTPDVFKPSEGMPARINDPQDIPVQLNIKIPWHYREQLTRMATEAGMSLTRFVANALVRQVPPERR